MALESDFLAMSTQTITVEPLSTVNAYGAPTFGTSTTYRAYIEPGTFITKNLQGVEEVASAMVYVLSSSASLAVQDRVTLPDGRKPKLIRVDILNDDEGQHHIEAAIG
jgi:hypothetical protein